MKKNKQVCRLQSLQVQVFYLEVTVVVVVIMVLLVDWKVLILTVS